MKAYKALSDDELLLHINKQDKKAFDVIYDRYMPLLYIYAHKFISDGDEVKDILQDVFLSIWLKGIPEIKTTFASYLYTCVRYKIFDFFDRQEVREKYVDSLQKFSEKGECITDNYLLEKELSTQIEKEIGKLPEKMREVFLMSRLSDKSHREIAESLNISDNTVKKQISNALKILRTKLSRTLLLILSLFIIYFY